MTFIFHKKETEREGLSSLHKAKHLLSSITETQVHPFSFSIFLNISAYQLVVPEQQSQHLLGTAYSQAPAQTNWTRNSGRWCSAIRVLASPSGDPDALKLENCCSVSQGLKVKLYV